MATSFVLLLWVFIALNGTDGQRLGIVGGREAAPNSRPYIASLQYKNLHRCGGVLVREDFVLTAAHCWIKRSYKVVLGAHSLSNDESTKQEFRAILSIQHPNYDGHENDVMLLKLQSGTTVNASLQSLDRKANLTRAVQLIPMIKTRPKRPSQCSTAGWGTMKNRTIADKLQEVQVNVLPLKECRRRWTTDVLITTKMVCATGLKGMQGFCSGDSGGPLVCNGASAGVVSFSGLHCGDPETPDVYMSTSSYRTWIRNVLDSN